MFSISGFVDQQLGQLLETWNIYSTVLAGLIAVILIVTGAMAQEPDTHPMILLRQSHASQVRNEGESAVYRSADSPHGYPLRSGLNVRQPGAPAYSGGRNGDLRDIWRRVSGEIPLEAPRDREVSSAGGEQPKITTFHGRESTEDHNIGEVTKDIHIVGTVLRKNGSKRVAIFLPNSIEFLEALFACSFYGLTPILIPRAASTVEVANLLLRTKADTLIAEAGLSLDELMHVSTLRQVIWVVERTSRHVDWTDVPADIGGKIDVSMWHQLIQDHQDIKSADAPDLKASELGNIITVWGDETPKREIVEFTHQNFVSAIAGLLATLPGKQRLNPTDLFLAADSWSTPYALVLTFAALWSHASLAITSQAIAGVDLTVATMGASPTVIVADASSAQALHDRTAKLATGLPQQLALWSVRRGLDDGYMPSGSLLDSVIPPVRARVGVEPSQLRLLFVTEGPGGPRLSADALADLRAFTHARVVRALTVPTVAGAVAQTGVFDYRRGAEHYGPPVGSVEVKLVDKAGHRTTDEKAEGELVVVGPAVAGGESRTGVLVKVTRDFTLAVV